MHKIAYLKDIAAPCEEVFKTVIQIDKRMQLSPLWGLSQLLDVSETYPEEGSWYRIRVNPTVPFGLSHGTLDGTQSALAGLAEYLAVKLEGAERHPVPAEPQQTKKPVEPNTLVDYHYTVLEFQPPSKLVYQLDNELKTVVTWLVKPIPLGSRVNYEECFCEETLVDPNFFPTMQRVVEEWLTNIKRYCELKGRPGKRLIKWFLDRFYLKLRPDQRRVVLIMLAMNLIGLATFILAVVVWGIPRLFF